MADDSEDEEILLFILLLRRPRRHKRACDRKVWSKSWILRRAGQGACDNLVQELAAEDPEQFRNYHRLDRVVSRIFYPWLANLLLKKTRNALLYYPKKQGNRHVAFPCNR